MTTRTPLEEIGEKRISLKDKSFFFKPSFSAMAEMGNPREIVELYAHINGSEYVKAVNSIHALPHGAQMTIAKAISKPTYGKSVLNAAYIIMQSCCEEDVSILIGSWKFTERGLKYVNGLMPINDIIIIARDLIEHGIIGKSPLKVLAKSVDNNKKTNEFSAASFINSARAHFGMSREEAESLTMTEFQQLVKIKFPEPKGLTIEDHDRAYEQVKSDREKLEAKRLRKLAMRTKKNG